MNEEFRYFWDYIYTSAAFLTVALLILSVSPKKLLTKIGLAIFALQPVIALITGKPAEYTLFSGCLMVTLLVLYFAKRKRETPHTND